MNSLELEAIDSDAPSSKISITKSEPSVGLNETKRFPSGLASTSNDSLKPIKTSKKFGSMRRFRSKSTNSESDYEKGKNVVTTQSCPALTAQDMPDIHLLEMQDLSAEDITERREWREIEHEYFWYILHRTRGICIEALNICVKAPSNANVKEEDLKGSFSSLSNLSKSISDWNANSAFYEEKMPSLLWSAMNTINKLSTFLKPLAILALTNDPHPDYKYNGFRSIISLCKIAVLQFMAKVNSFKIEHKNKLASLDNLFLAMQETFDIVHFLTDLVQIIASESWEAGMLFQGEVEKFIPVVKALNITSVLGDYIGFQFPPCLQRTFKVILISMASFKEKYHHDGMLVSGVAKSMIASFGYIANANKLADTLTILRTQLDIAFVKEFWNLTENTPVKHGPKITGPHLDVNAVVKISIPKVRNISKEEVADFKLYLDTVSMRILSCKWYNGQIFKNNHLDDYEKYVSNQGASYTSGTYSKKRAKNLLIHYHGGGFIAQSSLSHEVYLRPWAKELDCPIVSVDYSLSPEVQYPVAFKECYLAYLWCLEHFEKLGTLGEKIVMMGDSAGGNLAMAVALQAAEKGVRVPDLVIPVYPALHVVGTLSPSRCISVLDPLLPPFILLGCLNSYSPDQPNDCFLSPTMASDENLKKLKIYLGCCEFDPLLDDSIYFARRMFQISDTFKFKCFESAPHGFLNLASQSKMAFECTNFILNWIKSEFGLDEIPTSTEVVGEDHSKSDSENSTSSSSLFSMRKSRSFIGLRRERMSPNTQQSKDQNIALSAPVVVDNVMEQSFQAAMTTKETKEIRDTKETKEIITTTESESTKLEIETTTTATTTRNSLQVDGKEDQQGGFVRSIRGSFRGLKQSIFPSGESDNDNGNKK